MKTLHPHQARALDGLRDSLRVKRTRPILQAPTGWGKTVVGSHIIASAREKGRKVWFSVPAVELVEQSVRAFWDEGIRDIGVMQASHSMTDYAKPVQVVSPMTLEKRPFENLEKPDLILVDECHRMFAIIKRIIEEWPEVPVIGLSATPWSKGLGRYFNNLIISATTADLIRLGFLAPFKCFAPNHPDLTGVKVTTTAHGRDYAEGELSEAMQQGTLTGDIVATWLQRGRGRPTLVFGVDRAHALSLHKEFERAGVRSAYQDGATPKGEREEIRKGFASGHYEVVCNIATLTTGVDWDVRCIVLARPTKSEILFTQIIGRGLRTAEGKDHLLILDHSDTTLKLGFVTDILHTKLDDGAPAKNGDGGGAREPRQPRECPSCTVVFPKFARVCPECGFEPKIQAREIETEAGELVELDGNRRNKTAPWSEKIAFMAQLRAYVIEKGLKEGWAAHKYKARYGVWPNDPRVRNVPPAADVDPYVRSWIRSQNIRWAKAREVAA